MVLLFLAPVPEAQAFRKDEHPELGLTVQRPRKYAPIPRQPTEEWILLRYVEEKDKRNPKSILPELLIVRIDWVPDPEPETEPEEEEEGDNERGRSKSKLADEYKPKEKPLPINSLERYVERELRGFKLGHEIAAKKQRKKGDFVGTEFTLEPAIKERRRGWAFSWSNEAGTYALLGIASKDDVDKQSNDWIKVAEKLVISAPKESKETAKWRRFYEKRPEYTNPDFRLQLRASAVKGWRLDDSENYILIYSTKSEALVRDLKQRLEAIRKAYITLFPPAVEVDAVSAVRICKDLDEYHRYGGPRGSGGYWNAAAEELVFFEYEDDKGDRGSGKEDSRIVLYHEAFHQYIYYSVGELAPHSWFNEGYGDYFSGAHFNSYGEVQKIGVNPWRIRTIQRAIEDSNHVPWEKIVGFEQSEYYNPMIRHICYAQGWSMIYFLNHAKEVEKNPAWAKILPTYFEALKASHQPRGGTAHESVPVYRTILRAEGWPPTFALATRQPLQPPSMGVDFDAIEEAWKRKYTLSLKPPK